MTNVMLSIQKPKSILNGPRSIQEKYNEENNITPKSINTKVKDIMEGARVVKGKAKTKKEATKLFPGVVSLIDKLAKKNVIHKNKASNLKSKLSKLK